MLKKLLTTAVAASIVAFGFLTYSVAAPKAKAPKEEPPEPLPPANEDVATPAVGAKMVLGTYTGPFGPHRITICLQNLIGNTVNGYSIVAGNERAFSGSLAENPHAFEVHAREPGDDQNDGSFVFEYRPSVGHLTGTWTPNSARLKKVTFDLPRKDFKYDPKSGAYPQASTRVLKTADVENVRPEDLRIMRNEIYARHGYTFRLPEMRNYFEKQDWYMPMSFNVSTQLTPTEQKNEALIKRYEDYGTEHYDEFGR